MNHMPENQATVEERQDENDPVLDPDTVRAMGERFEAFGQRMLDAVQQHPLTAVGVALGAGFLLGRLIRR
jgi:ElaB/YqjD/DUF883 family membrane-anchored ribosome-binding protein